MNKESKIYVAGHRGLVGSALVRRLLAHGYTKWIGRTHDALDLTDPYSVREFFREHRPEYVFLAAAKVGGVCSNQHHEAEFLRDNFAIANNVLDAAWFSGVKKLLFLGSACVYPKEASIPIRESSLLSGPLEPSNQWYALAKIAGIKLCEAYSKQFGANFISCMPTNLYGPNDHYDPVSSHAVPALIRKIHLAKMNNQPSVKLWGTGKPTREFLYSEDLADACITLMNNYDGKEPVNIGTGAASAVTIAYLADTIAKVIGYKGSFQWDPSKPDGTPKRSLSSDKIFRMGWKPKHTLYQGLEQTYEDFIARQLHPLANLVYDSMR